MSGEEWKLCGLAGETRTVRVLAAAKLAGLPIVLEELRALKKGTTPTNRLPFLRAPNGQLAFSAHSACRLLAACGSSEIRDDLLGSKSDNMAMARVAQWMDIAQELLDPIAEVSAMDAGSQLAASAGVAGPESVSEQATAKLVSELKAWLEDGILISERFLAGGDTPSLADVCVCTAICGPLAKSIAPKVREKHLNEVVTWFDRVREAIGLDDFLLAKFEYFAGKGAAEKAVKDEMDALAAKAKIIIGEPMGKESVHVQQLFSRGRSRVKNVLAAGESNIGSTVVVCGWARTIRTAAKGSVAFVELNDGSCQRCLQVVANAESTKGFDKLVAAGGASSSHRFIGEIVKSQGEGQAIELQVANAEVLGKIDPTKYPLAGYGHSLEFLREQAHLRARSQLIAAVARIRNASSFAIHDFFRKHGFLYVHTPIITSSDCEGAGEMMAVTTLLGQDGRKIPVIEKKQDETDSLKIGDIDWRQDFFGRPVFLTVSGQLNVETYACALSDVYTFGPTFRAENSHTSRHLAEFWMVEPELCFAELKDDIDLAEEFVKYCTKYVLENCTEDVDFCEEKMESGLRKRLLNVIETPFKRLQYTEAIDILQDHVQNKGVSFEEYPEWGIDLGSEHERFLCEKVYNGPVVLTDYPADIKAFYMRQNELDEKDRLTVQAMDVLVPRIGELVGGSAREERLGRLQQRIVDMNLKPEDFEWYCDLRRFGSVPHAGFGMGFDRFVMFVTGAKNVRDVIPFPRYAGTCRF